MKVWFIPLNNCFSKMLIAAGFVLVLYGLWNIADTNFQTSQSLQEAKKLIEEGKAEAEDLKQSAGRFAPVFGDVIGILEIPKLNGELPIVEGTSPDDLEKGVGHYKGSYFPNENGQIVLSGHRDTVFRQIGELEIGDSLILRVPYGEFKYTIIDTKIVDADDTSIITLQNDYEELILTTCYPFTYVGDAPERYIIYAERAKG